MKRALSVALIAALTAAISGIHDTSWAGQNRASQAGAQREKVAAAVQGIPIGSPIAIDPVRGEKFEAILEELSSDAIVVRLATGNNAVTRMIPLDEIRSLKKIRKLNDHRTRNVLIVVGVGAVVVLVGTCANALRSAD